MGSTSISWEVSSFEVQVTTPNATSDALYANGSMQVPVIVVISAINPDSNSPYELDDSELEKIRLIDYDDPPTEIKGSWSYSVIENEFEHGLPSTKMAVQSDLSLAAEGPQKKRYWVTTTKIEDKRIAASIEQPNGTVVHTGGGNFDSKVILVGTNPVMYNLDNLIWEQQGDFVSGKFSDGGGWVLRNLSLTTNKYDLRKAEFQGYNPGTTDAALEYAISFLKIKGIDVWSSILYYWPMGSEETRRVGIGSYTAETTINQKSNALCVTHIQLIESGIESSNWWEEGRFTFYDKFGNSGTFWLGYGDEDWNHVAPIALEQPYTPK
ncbi:hypothetical protein AbraIFM66951_009324 [Aspergillus brasiliensis]|uniref:Uncharacterized protein n=1 Tax=Aspergillus brasiliensis TaxID=319629 RepID=A0A9W5YUV1_9EURO|nr:hypothetical protein AbraCBS73388_009114 [Aspergillus brasiliensis]GKZ46391.1 hypothetical protein AbraIFM66951_009324 [Aspergillus brasiliensis]